jgi:hypothetical protein
MPRNEKPTRPLTDAERTKIGAELAAIRHELEEIAPKVGAVLPKAMPTREEIRTMVEVAIAELRPSQRELYIRKLQP